MLCGILIAYSLSIQTKVIIQEQICGLDRQINGGTDGQLHKQTYRRTIPYENMTVRRYLFRLSEHCELKQL